MDFGELVFGGNTTRNLELEANLNARVLHKKLVAASRKNSGFLELLPERGTPLRKHKQKLNAEGTPLTTIFAKLPPKHAIERRYATQKPPSPRAVHLEGPSHAAKIPTQNNNNMPIIFFADIIESGVYSSQDSTNNPFAQFRLNLANNQDQHSFVRFDDLPRVVLKGSD